MLVDHALTHDGPAAVLVNLHPSPPPFFSRFERLVEVIGTDENEAAAGRERWKFYKARGYEVRSHNLAERALTRETDAYRTRTARAGRRADAPQPRTASSKPTFRN